MDHFSLRSPEASENRFAWVVTRAKLVAAALVAMFDRLNMFDHCPNMYVVSIEKDDNGDELENS